MAEAKFSTKSLQLAIFLHASEALPFLRTERDRDSTGKVNFIFLDDAGVARSSSSNTTAGPLSQPATSSHHKPSFGNK
jgi:hypothetical protein